MSVQGAVGGGDGEGGRDIYFLCVVDYTKTGLLFLLFFNRDQHAGNLTLRYLSGVMSGRLMKGTEDVRSVPAISVHVTSSHDLCTSFEKKPVDASPIQSWRSRQCTESKFPAPRQPPPPPNPPQQQQQSSHGIVDSAQKVNPGTLIILQKKNMRQNSSDSRKAKKTDGSLTSVHVYKEQVSK